MLTALSLGLTAARDSLANDPERSARQLTELKKMGTQVLHELQSLVSGLRPSTLDDLGLVPALRSLLSQFEQTGMTVRLQIQGHTRRIQPEIETVLFRIAQESLTNAARHAQADSVQLMLTFAADSIALQVQDDGIGFDLADVLRVEQRKHWGLVGIEERVSLVGGKSQIYSQPGAGTTILVTIPLQEEPVHA
jgi:signal transduction histidine kinase